MDARTTQAHHIGPPPTQHGGQPPRPSESVLAQIGTALEEAHGAMNTLEERLRPVLAPEGGELTAAPRQDPYNGIRQTADQAEALRNRINRLIKRIEL